jgi:hypothetical protein
MRNEKLSLWSSVQARDTEEERRGVEAGACTRPHGFMDITHLNHRKQDPVPQQSPPHERLAPVSKLIRDLLNPSNLNSRKPQAGRPPRVPKRCNIGISRRTGAKPPLVSFGPALLPFLVANIPPPERRRSRFRSHHIPLIPRASPSPLRHRYPILRSDVFCF